MKKTIYSLVFSLLILLQINIRAQAWSELGGTNSLSANDVIASTCTDASGNVYTSGSFSNASTLKYVAKFNGTTWGELGGTNGLAANGSIDAICSDKSGNIYAGGSFTNT